MAIDGRDTSSLHRLRAVGSGPRELLLHVQTAPFPPAEEGQLWTVGVAQEHGLARMKVVRERSRNLGGGGA